MPAIAAGGPRRIVIGALAVAAVLVVTVAVVVPAPWESAGDPHAGIDDVLIGPDHYASAVAVCGLLEADDVELALGASYPRVFEPDFSYAGFAGIPGITRCVYVGQAGAVALGVVYAYADQIFTQRKSFLSEVGEVTDVGDVGDDAVYSHAAGELVVLADDHLVGVKVPVTAAVREDDRIERARRLAATVIERLQ